MNIAFKIMAFSIVLNLAVGIMMNGIVDVNGNKFFDGVGNPYRRGLDYDATHTDVLAANLNGTVTPDGAMENTESFIYRVLDKLNMGFTYKFLASIPDYIYGFINILQVVTGTFMDEDANEFIFGSFKVLLTIGYLLGGLYLWRGQELFKG